MRAVFVEYDPYNRMGNRMFQYAFGYIISKRFKCPLYTKEGIPNFGIEPNLPPNLAAIERIHTRDMGDQFFDFNLLKGFAGDLFINSWVQKSEYYLDYREDLREVFNIKSQPPINERELCMHIRSGDYNMLGVFLGYAYYKQLINDSPYKFSDVKIVTDSPRSDAVLKLINDGCKLVTDGNSSQFSHHSDSRAMSDFETLLYSSNIVLSQSSFSWWAAFLGNHKQVIFPFKRNIDWWPMSPNQDDIDLYFDFNNTSNKYIV